MPVSSQTCQHSCIFMSEVSISPLSVHQVSIVFCKCSDTEAFLFFVFHFIFTTNISFAKLLSNNMIHMHFFTIFSLYQKYNCKMKHLKDQDIMLSYTSNNIRYNLIHFYVLLSTHVEKTHYKKTSKTKIQLRY